MPLNSSQLISQACAIAKVPGYTAQAGIFLNMLLQTLCQDYDFDFIKKPQTISLNGNTGYALNADHLRTKEVYYNVNGEIFYLFQIPIETFHSLPIPAGVSNYPNKYSVDVSTSPNTLLFYPPPSIAQDVQIYYYPQMPDIDTPETDTSVPWFTNQEYILVRLSSMLMRITDDERQPLYDAQADKILSKMLVMKDDKEGFSDTIKLSRERFRTGNNSNPSKAFPLG